jgi:hypothetical protein
MTTTLTFVERTMQPALAASGLSAYEDFVSSSLGEIVAESGSSRTRKFALDEIDGKREYFLKTYRYAGRRRRFALRADKAALEASNYRFLRDVCRIDVPDVICWGLERKLWRICSAFVLTRGIAEAVPLDSFVATRWPKPEDGFGDPLRERIMELAASLVRRMHAAHFYHVDLQWRNILIVQDSSAAPRLFIIDSSRGGPRTGRLFQEHGRLRDLSSLAKEAAWRLTRTERLRWLQQYLGVRRLDPNHRLIVRTVERDRVLKDNDRR